ncbi:hypothetical protein Rin_00011340, partial [Candidatus Regiella insecticola 5.15]
RALIFYMPFVFETAGLLAAGAYQIT